MIQTTIHCDNCRKKIQVEPDDVNLDNPNWEPEKYSKLEIRIVGIGKVPVSMELCVRCTRKYIRKLTKPLEVEGDSE